MEPSTEASRLARLPSRLLSRAALVASRHVTQALEGVGGHRYDFAVLATLDEFGPLSQSELCRRCGMDRSDMTAVVSALADEGHVSRTPDADDRRRKVVRLEPAGRRRLEVLEQAIEGAQQQLLEGSSPDDRDRLVALLTPLAARADQ